MRTPCLVLLCGAAALHAGASQEPSRPDFSGGWTAVKDAPPGVVHAPSPVFGNRFWLEQQATRLTVVRPVRDTAVRAEHVVDGAEVRSRVPGGPCLGDAAVVTRVAWEGQALVHTTVATVPAGGAAQVPAGLRHLFRLASPDTLQVESTMRVPGQTEPKVVATIYRRMADPAPPATPSVSGAPAVLADVAWLSGSWIGTIGSATIENGGRRRVAARCTPRRAPYATRP